jgi:hypothetical protein
MINTIYIDCQKISNLEQLPNHLKSPEQLSNHLKSPEQLPNHLKRADQRSGLFR